MMYKNLVFGIQVEGGRAFQIDNCKPALLQMANNAGLRLNKAIIINSGYRSELHNKEVGGAVDSPHLRGMALDIHCNESVFRFNLIGELMISGFSRIGIAKNFIHVDISDTPVKECIWLY
jgi:uncharacterized protein YcbK (DUF882 family)